MIRWCMVCQKFMGQKEPYNDFSLTHGLCGICRQNGISNLEKDVNFPVKEFYGELLSYIHRGEFVEPDYLLKRGRDLNLARHEMYLGVLHPLLWQIGDEFEAGSITPEKERLFSTAVNLTLDKLRDRSATSRARVLLIQPPGNSHTIGLEFFACLLAERAGIPSVIVEKPPTTSSELESLVSSFRPDFIGVSVALAVHVKFVEKLKTWLSPFKDIRILVGGPAVSLLGDHGKNRSVEGVHHISNPFDTLGTLSELKKMKGHSG